MNDFLEFFDEIVKGYPMHLDITYSRITDWCISIWRKGCGENGEDVYILNVFDSDIKLCLAKAQVGLKEWLLENYGGY